MLKRQKYISSLLGIILLCIISNGTLLAQSYFFRHYQVENGLSNNTVYCSVQDENGFLWFGTKEGLNRFDGYHFKVFKANEEQNTFYPDFINCLFSDKGILWVGSTKGLFQFNYYKERLEPFITNEVIDQVGAIQMDGKHQLWFTTRQELCRYNFQTKKLTRFPNTKYYAISALAVDKAGKIWAATTNGLLYQFDTVSDHFNTYDLFKHSPSVSSKWIHKLHIKDNKTVYIGTASQGLKVFDVAKKSYIDLLTNSTDKTNIHIRDLLQYAPNELWIATESGIYILNTLTNQFINLKKKFLDPFSLADNAVYSLCKDKEGSVWAGTYFGGINYYSKQYALFEKFFADNSKKSISGNAVREICEDKLGNIWIGTEDAGLNKLNPRTGTITQFLPTGQPHSIAYPNIHGLLAIGNEIWIGTFEHGLDRMDIHTGKVIKHYNAGAGKYDLKNNFIVSLLQTQSGDIYVGTATSLFKYHADIDGFSQVVEIPTNDMWFANLFEDHNHTLWVGTHNGVFYFNPITKVKGTIKFQQEGKNGLTNTNINAIYEDSKHCLWFATEGGGVCKLSENRKKMTAITTKNGLPSNFIFKVLEDNTHNIWLTTSRGLVKLETTNNTIVVYTKDNGLLSDQFNYNSGYKNAQGVIYLGSAKGMIRFNPIDIIKTTTAAPIFITGFSVQNKEQEIDKNNAILKESILFTTQITLPYDKSSFNIDFAALSYISPEMTQYCYFMKGLDKEWTEIKPNRKVYFTNLPPGEYTFKLKAFMNGHWTKEQKQLKIRIMPPWWATTWAYLGYIALLVSLIYYLLRSYHIMVEDKKAKEIYEAKIDFFTNLAHEIRTPLTLIKGPVENLLEYVEELPDIKEDVVLMERNTNRLIALVTQILDFRKVESKNFSLYCTRVNASEMLKETFSNFKLLTKKRKIEYSLTCPSDDVFVFADEEALTKILSNLFNNAIKFAHKKVAIRLLPIDVDAAYVTFEFENDGLSIPIEMKEKIFEPFYRLKESKQEGTGIGLALARSLAELLNGDLCLKDTNDGSIVFVLTLPIEEIT